MSRLLTAFIACLFLCLPAFAQNAGSTATPTVTDVRIGAEKNNQTRFVLDITQAVPYRAFVLNNPMRLVVDLPKIDWTAPMNKGDARHTIKAYRKGIYNTDTLRLVVDLNKPMIVNTHMRLPPEQGRPWRYVFDLKPVDPLTFQRALNTVTTGGGAPATATNGVHTAPALQSPQTTTATAQKALQTAPTLVKKKLVVLDAGHGGVDPGALATNGVYEKTITLAVAREVKRLLTATGRYDVKMTRDTDIYIKLPDRVKIARRANADLFISLHADTIGRPQVHGASVYTLSDTASDAETAKLAERENAVDSLVNVDVGHVDADVEDILIDLVTRDTMNQSRVLAETVVDTFHVNGVSTLPLRPHRSAGFAVLKAPDIPSVLIEMGYLSNKQEAARLASDDHRRTIAQAVVRTIERYFSQTSKQAAY